MAVGKDKKQQWHWGQWSTRPKTAAYYYSESSSEWQELPSDNSQMPQQETVTEVEDISGDYRRAHS